VGLQNPSVGNGDEGSVQWRSAKVRCNRIAFIQTRVPDACKRPFAATRPASLKQSARERRY